MGHVLICIWAAARMKNIQLAYFSEPSKALEQSNISSHHSAFHQLSPITIIASIAMASTAKSKKEQWNFARGTIWTQAIDFVSWVTSGPIDRTPGLPAFNKNIDAFLAFASFIRNYHVSKPLSLSINPKKYHTRLNFSAALIKSALEPGITWLSGTLSLVCQSLVRYRRLPWPK